MTFPQFDPHLSADDILLMERTLRELEKPELNFEEIHRCVDELAKRQLLSTEELAEIKRVLAEAEAETDGKIDAEALLRIRSTLVGKIESASHDAQSSDAPLATIIQGEKDRLVYQAELAAGDAREEDELEEYRQDRKDLAEVEQICLAVGEEIREREEREASDEARTREETDVSAQDVLKLKERYEELRDLTIQEDLLGGAPCLFKLELEAMDRGVLKLRKKSA